ncbi:glycosyltransferase family 4 protein [bacterium]|nr:glycosyltransferase family 4 protein [bacterium]RQV93734.1 MAG: glycosyltransferase family 1 protein [bacterium]
MKKLKILHIITYLPIGGAQDNTLLTVEGLDKDCYDITLICGKRGEWIDRALSIKGIKIHFINELIRKIHIFYDVIALLKMYHFIKKGKFKIVHTHSSKAGFSGRIAAYIAGVPVIIHTLHGFPFHDFMYPAERMFYIYLERFLSKLSGKIITVSHLNREKAIRLKLNRPEKFINIYSGINFRRFNHSVNVVNKKKELGISKKDQVVGMVGRLSEQKAPQYFIQAIPTVLQVHPHVHFLLVGDGELKNNIMKMTEKLNISNHVFFLGFRNDVPEILKIFNVFVLPSLWEGLGRSLTEAMYSACAVIGTAVEGVPELIINGKTGYLVQPKDSDAIAQRILDYLSNPRKAKQIGNNARKRVMKDFDVNIMINKIDQLYQNMLNKIN